MAREFKRQRNFTESKNKMYIKYIINKHLFVLCAILVLLQIIIEIYNPAAILIFFRNVILLAVIVESIIKGVRGLITKDKSKRFALLHIFLGYSLYGISCWLIITIIHLSSEAVNMNERSLKWSEGKLAYGHLKPEIKRFLNNTRARDMFIKSSEIDSVTDSNGIKKPYIPTPQDIQQRQLLSNLKTNNTNLYYGLFILSIAVVFATCYSIFYKNKRIEE